MTIRKALVSGAAVAVLAAFMPVAVAQSPSNAELLERIERLEAQNAALMSRLDGMIEDSEIARVPA